MNALIIGGNSGLGKEIGVELSDKGYAVHATGRQELNIATDLDKLRHDLDGLIERIPVINLLVYAAGFAEKGRLGELGDDHIAQMINVGLTTPALIIERIIKRQDSLSGFIAITSTSQWIPREMEPVYTAVKAGLAMLAQSASLDRRIGKTLVVGPTGMDTNFWAGTGREDTHRLLNPKLVGKQILELWADPFSYRLARILRDPSRVEILETR